MAGEDKARFKRILVPLDGSELGERALPYVEELAAATGAEVLLLEVVALQYDIALAETYTPNVGQLSEDFAKRTLANAEKYLKSIEERLSQRGITVRSEIETGVPAERVIAHAKEYDVDLIAMSTHGRSGISRWILGSVADKVLRAADRPVLLVRASEKAGGEG
ncbi:universal stress protein [Chloroflexota bacterium]